ncbi:MAG: hypothetical protein ACYC69_11295 [Thermodesulfovibrionales bacterium]
MRPHTWKSGPDKYICHAGCSGARLGTIIARTYRTMEIQLLYKIAKKYHSLKKAGSVLCIFTGLIAVVIASGGCASSISSTVLPPSIVSGDDGESAVLRKTELIRQVELRASTVETSAEWIQQAYEKPLIRHLRKIQKRDYADFAKYLDKGAVYIIVHPAYSFFFDDSVQFGTAGRSSNGKSAMSNFLSETAYSGRSRLAKAQEKVMHDFLEYISTEKKLVLFILPGSYQKVAVYRDRFLRDEYMRYINEVSNESESVLYLFSSKPNKGKLGAKDRKILFRFLEAVQAKTILLGGGYIGRCIEDFYRMLGNNYDEDNLFIVPEISALSPSDMSASMYTDVVSPDGFVDINKLALNAREFVAGGRNGQSRIKNYYPPSGQ